MHPITYELINPGTTVGEYFLANPDLLEVPIKRIKVVLEGGLNNEHCCDKIPDSTTIGEFLALCPEVKAKVILTLEIWCFDEAIAAIRGHRVISNATLRLGA